MSRRADLERRRDTLNRLLSELYLLLSAANGKLEDLETEYDLVADHANKLEENIAFLRKEAQVVKLKEYKAAVEAHNHTVSVLQTILLSLEETRSECTRGLTQTEAFLSEIKTIDTALEQGAKIYEFSNDKRRDQDAD